MRESHRERTLLRLIEQQQRIIADLNDRLMFLADRTWTPPPTPTEQTYVEPDGELPTYSFAHELPPGYGE